MSNGPDASQQFLIYDGTEESGRAFVLHLEYPKFVIEFASADLGELISADPAPADMLEKFLALAVSFYTREIESFAAYRIVRPEN